MTGRMAADEWSIWIRRRTKVTSRVTSDSYSFLRTAGGRRFSRRSRRRDSVSRETPGRGWVSLKVVGMGMS